MMCFFPSERQNQQASTALSVCVCVCVLVFMWVYLCNNVLIRVSACMFMQIVVACVWCCWLYSIMQSIMCIWVHMLLHTWKGYTLTVSRFIQSWVKYAPTAIYSINSYYHTLLLSWESGNESLPHGWQRDRGVSVCKPGWGWREWRSRLSAQLSHGQRERLKLHRLFYL